MSFFILKKLINSVEKLLIFHIFFLLFFINTKKNLILKYIRIIFRTLIIHLKY
jgi:hypothetical protein